jgi:hypothetical protein
MLRPFDSEIESNLRRFQNCDYAWQHPDARSTAGAQTELSASRQKRFSAPHKLVGCARPMCVRRFRFLAPFRSKSWETLHRDARRSILREAKFSQQRKF